MNGSERYDHGTFCWADLATGDVETAKAFYGGLFGWSFCDNVMDPQNVYTLCQLDGGNAAGLYRMMPDQPAPCWTSYLAVDNCDYSAEKLRGLGGTVVQPPFDIPQVGRMAVVSDPHGAVFCLWQADNPHPGAARFDMRPGSVCWNELASPDTTASQSFYRALFGWGVRETSMPDHTYTEWLRDDQPVGGMLPLAVVGPDVPPHWLVYFSVEDCDRSVETARDLGGRTLRPPFDVEGVGRIAVLSDPGGAAFAVIALG
jgi:hypothetical protein